MSKLFLISGPCIVENETTPYLIAKTVKPICDELGIEYIFKASYRKANRTRVDSFTGIGDEAALQIIQGIGREFGVKTLTDIHESHEAAMVAAYVDVLQIPAFLCRQTALLQAAGETGKIVNIKKGQFVSPEAMKYPVEKVLATGNRNVWVCERGFTFGYEDLVAQQHVIIPFNLNPIACTGKQAQALDDIVGRPHHNDWNAHRHPPMSDDNPWQVGVAARLGVTINHHTVRVFQHRKGKS